MHFEKLKDGIILELQNGKLKIRVFSENIFRVIFSPNDDIPECESLIVNRNLDNTDWEVIRKKEHVIIKTENLKAEINSRYGAVDFFDKTGKILLREKPDNPRSVKSTNVMGEKTWEVEQRFILTENEALYGLGQIQDGKVNHRGKNIILVQTNINAINPFLVSTNGYGILWDNYSKTLFHDGPDGMTFRSQVADRIDYYFIAGENIDNVIEGYRFLTGDAPMYGKWAFGYWQSKERYIDAKELVDTVKEYRKRKIPIDNIVQDWRYWGENENWSSMQFDENIFPEPEKMISGLHGKYNVHLMVSIWPAVGVKTDIYKELKKKRLLYPPEHWGGGYIYDPYNSDARRIYWKYIYSGLISKGVDALWMDGTEPELESAHEAENSEKYMKKLGNNALGTMARYLNPYSLMTTKGAYEGFRNDAPDKRVMILTRSAFAGQQRYAAATWSGDVAANWKVFRNQISAGINFCMAGIPYWSHDIGAFFVTGQDFGHGPGMYSGGCKDPAYREFYIRWFQFGAFSPIFRSHGTQTPREVWQFGEKGSPEYEVLLKFDNLRYRLMPYIYSLAWKVTKEQYTIMRGLAMDFTDDENVFDIDNQYMFGTAFLVCPVIKEMYYSVKESGKTVLEKFLQPEDIKDKTVEIYLPESAGWFDFWTGEYYKGGRTVNREAPLDIMPLYIKAGSIIPVGPFKQYSTEKEEDPIELRIYPGADALFTLYEDENDNYNYEKGVYAAVKFGWNETDKTLIICERKGEFPGMLKERTFHIVYVRKNHGTGVDVTENADITVKYSGKLIKVKIK